MDSFACLVDIVDAVHCDCHVSGAYDSRIPLSVKPGAHTSQFLFAEALFGSVSGDNQNNGNIDDNRPIGEINGGHQQHTVRISNRYVRATT